MITQRPRRVIISETVFVISMIIFFYTPSAFYFYKMARVSLILAKIHQQLYKNTTDNNKGEPMMWTRQDCRDQYFLISLPVNIYLLNKLLLCIVFKRSY